MRKKTTVIATVLNEAGSISGLLESLAHQTRRPDAVIIVDGGSTDGTVDVLCEWESAGRLPLRVIEAPGANISRGRNIAISAAETEIIAGTDAGTQLSPDWLENLMAPFEQDPPPDVVAGFFVADSQTVFETALGATTLPVIDDVNPNRFLPSSRSIAFRRSVWQDLGGYPEWLDFCEDLLFDLWLREDGYRIAFAPDAIAHFRPRRSLREFFWQYYRYARGDGKADLWPMRHVIRYGTYLIAVPALLYMAVRGLPRGGLQISDFGFRISDFGFRIATTQPACVSAVETAPNLRQPPQQAREGPQDAASAKHVLSLAEGLPFGDRSPAGAGRLRKGDVLSLSKGCRDFNRQAERGLAWLALVVGAGLMLRPPVQRLWRLTRGWSWGRRLQALAWVPIIRVTGDFAKMLGYPVGRWWRRQHCSELRSRRGRPPFGLSQILDRS
jgi:glycosyltransferase involved in cell wall biosynthesis